MSKFDLSEIDKSLYSVDFSANHKQSVWREICSRLPSDATGLTVEELDAAAGGLSIPPEEERRDK